MTSVAVVGAGISGLLTAFFLQKKGYAVTVFEKEPRVGGKLQTVQSPYGLMESAANGILCDAFVEDVLLEIGVEPLATLKSSRARYIYKNRKATRWPLGLLETVRLASFFLRKPWIAAKNISNTDLESWLALYLSKNTIDYLITPACQGIFGKGAKDLSASLVMNYFFNKKKIAKGKSRGTVSAQEGLGEILQKLEAFLKAQGVSFIVREIHSLNELIIDFKEVVVATDIQVAARLLESIRDLRGQTLKTVPLVDLASINVFVQETQSPYPGFGILFPRDEGIVALGVLQNTYIFSNRSQDDLSETWIYELSPKATDDDLIAQLKKDRESVFGTSSRFLYTKINRWPQALPLYGKELEYYLKNTPPGHPRVHLIGNYLGDIGLNRLFQKANDLAQTI